MEVAAHDIKNTMNGVAVNLEVVRSRVSKDTVTPSAVAPFANVAAEQLERLTLTTEALLALARPAPDPVNIGVVLRQLETLVGHLAQGARAQVTVDAMDEATVQLDAELVRVVLGEAMLSALDSPGPVRCVVSAGQDDSIRVRFDGGGDIGLGDGVAAAARAADIRLTLVEGSPEITFPISRTRARKVRGRR